MFLALSVFDNFLFEFDKISLLAVAAGSRGVAPSVLNVDSEELGGRWLELLFKSPSPTDPKPTQNMPFKNPSLTYPYFVLHSFAVFSFHLGLYLGLI